ncbi:hypothetical protein ILUMI_17546 [Ignelater luminosus]|uniref:Reverse transcriptase domain-containing protein n=1 Tax=Ignelater luminosus TaxID=2038154 RepID=A0A8K0G4Y9_IGNLU|nr:hypothetical protein ILUMI_17546 [Ignelater luminosus]
MVRRYRERMDQKMERMEEHPGPLDSNQKNHRKCCRGSNWKTRTPEEEGMRPRMQKARREEYEDLRGVAKNICKKKKRQQVENQIGKIQKLHARKTKGFYKENFEIKQSLRQGDGLAPLLFNIALDRVVKATSTDGDGTILNKDKQIVGYVDDLDLARSKKALKE